MKKKIVSSIILLIFISTSISAVGKHIQERSFLDSWDNEIVLKTGIDEVAEAFISYDNKIIYADEPYYKNVYNHPLKTKLILRSIDDVNSSETRQIYGTILGIDGSLPYDDLTSIRISTLESYHGKLFVGITANDPYQRTISPGQEPYISGTNDEYRRRVYVTSSVEEGYLISNPYYDEALSGLKIMNIDSIVPKPPHTISTPDMQSPTYCSIQVRTAETQENLEVTAWSDHYEENTAIIIPQNHEYIQYRVNMQTDDISLTPIVKKIEFVNPIGEVILSDSSWINENDYQSKEGISGTLSNGELVLDNLLDESLSPPQVHFSYLFQAPAKQEPPDWVYDIKRVVFPGDTSSAPRNFARGCWPYPGVVSMEVFKEKLFMNIGCQAGECHGMTAGEFASYNYESGLIKTEAIQYSQQPFDWWNEGNGNLRVVGDLLINPGVDTKSCGPDLVENPEIPGGCQNYQFTDGSGEWYIGITPSAGIFGVHIWDIAEFDGKLFIGRSNGCYYRDMPDDFESHSSAESYNPDSWTLLPGTEHHEHDPGTPGQAIHRFILYGNKFIVKYSDSWRFKGNRYNEKTLLTYDQNLQQISETDINSFTVGSDRDGLDFEAYILHNHRLITWNCKSGDIPSGGFNSGGFGAGQGELMQYEKTLSSDLRPYYASRLYYTN